MAKLSPFHSLVSSNHKALHDEYMNCTNASFCKKYKVGAQTVSYYFWGLKKPWYNSDPAYRENRKEKIQRMLHPKKEETDEKKKEKVDKIVRKLLRTYTMNEITNGKFIP